MIFCLVRLDYKFIMLINLHFKSLQSIQYFNNQLFVIECLNIVILYTMIFFQNK